MKLFIRYAIVFFVSVCEVPRSLAGNQAQGSGLLLGLPAEGGLGSHPLTMYLFSVTLCVVCFCNSVVILQLKSCAVYKG